MERQPYPPPGSCVAKNSQRPASVETLQGGVPPYGVKDTLVVNGKWCKMCSHIYNDFLWKFLLHCVCVFDCYVRYEM